MEVNNYLTEFPPPSGTSPLTKLEVDQIKEIAQYGIPYAWRTQLHFTNFDIESHTLKEFIEAVERIEVYENNADGKQDASDKNNGKAKTNGKRRRNNTNGKNGKTENDRDGTNVPNGEYYCMLHGKNSTHNTEQCKSLKFQIKKQKEATSAKYKTSKEEMHAVFKDLLKEEKAKTKRRRQRTSDRVSNELHALDNITLSETSDDNDSTDDDTST